MYEKYLVYFQKFRKETNGLWPRADFKKNVLVYWAWPIGNEFEQYIAYGLQPKTVIQNKIADCASFLLQHMQVNF